MVGQIKRFLFMLLPLQFVILIGCNDPTGTLENADDLLLNPAVKPVVVSASPPTNSQGPYESDDLIQIRFNKIMDRNSLTTAIRISNSLGQLMLDTSQIDLHKGELSFRYSLFVLGQGGNIFVPKIGETYVVTISTRAQDIYGNHLREDFQLVLKPEPQFRVKYISSLEISPSSFLIIGFNSPVSEDNISLISIGPGVTADWHYNDGRKINIYTELPYVQFNRNYTLSIPDNVRDIYGNQLITGFTKTFKTPPFQVAYQRPADGDWEVDVTDDLSFTFTGTLDTNSISSAFTLEPAVEGTFHNSSNTIRFVPSDELPFKQSYTAVVSGALRARDGTPLLYPVTTHFATRAFKVESRIPNEDQGVPRNAPILLRLTSSYDSTSVSPSFSITPSVAGTFDYHTNDVPQRMLGFVPNSPLEPRTRYTLRISGALVSKKGVHIEPFIDSFVTGY